MIRKSLVFVLSSDVYIDVIAVILLVLILVVVALGYTVLTTTLQVRTQTYAYPLRTYINGLSLCTPLLLERAQFPATVYSRQSTHVAIFSFQS